MERSEAMMRTHARGTVANLELQSAAKFVHEADEVASSDDDNEGDCPKPLPKTNRRACARRRSSARVASRRARVSLSHRGVAREHPSKPRASALRA